MGKFTLGFVVAAALICSGGASARNVVNGPSDIYAVGSFYSDYEHFNVHGLVGFHPGCVKDQYGFYKNPNCQDVDDNNASYDVHVYQTYPKWKFVHSERDYMFHGHDTLDLFWDGELGAPFCGYGTRWSRNYKAVLRLFDPVTGNVSARDTETFGVHCS